MDVFSLPYAEQFLKPNWDRIVALYNILEKKNIEISPLPEISQSVSEQTE